MAVIASREVLPRTFSHRFGESPTAERKFVVTVDEPTATQTIINGVGIFHGASHPEYPYLRCLDAQFTETDRQHVEGTYRYEVPKQENLEPNPLARPDVWSFSAGGAQVPALFCYDGDAVAPLVNSAGDFIDGVTATIAEMRATISGNRATFDYARAASIANCINDALFLGGAPFTWLCTGISGQQQTEVVNDLEIRYWAVTAELIYRENTHLLFLPDVGYNYIATSETNDAATSSGQGAATEDPPLTLTTQSGVNVERKKARTAGGVKKRAWVYSPDGSEKQNSPQPVALNTDGSKKADGASPNILARRMHRLIDFAQYFGTPTF